MLNRTDTTGTPNQGKETSGEGKTPLLKTSQEESRVLARGAASTGRRARASRRAEHPITHWVLPIPSHRRNRLVTRRPEPTHSKSQGDGWPASKPALAIPPPRGLSTMGPAQGRAMAGSQERIQAHTLHSWVYSSWELSGIKLEKSWKVLKKKKRGGRKRKKNKGENLDQAAYCQPTLIDNKTKDKFFFFSKRQI